MHRCELCDSPGGVVLWETAAWRVVRVADPDYPGFCRVIWNDHVREMTDLDPSQRRALLDGVLATEAAIRRLYSPDKVNLASFGNLTPHLHWHVIPRWADDRHFPEPIWGRVQRATSPARPAVADADLQAALQASLAELAQPSRS